MVTVETIKLFLGLRNEEDSVQDALIAQLIDDATAIVTNYINESALPNGLRWVVRDMVISRYNRIGSEGLKSASEEGRSENYDAELFNFGAFTNYLDSYVDGLGKPRGNGRAKFL